MITTGSLKMQIKAPHRPPSLQDQMKALALFNIEGHTEPCPKDGAPMYLKRAPCWLEKAGFKRAAKCLRCGYQKGIK